MSIYAERTIKVKNNTAKLNKDIHLYKGDRNVYLYFKVEGHDFGVNGNIIPDTIEDVHYPSHAYVTFLTPIMEEVAMGKGTIKDNKVCVQITRTMIDDMIEVGDYTMVIDLYDETGDSLVTLPPIFDQIHVYDRMTELTDKVTDTDIETIYDETTENLEIVKMYSMTNDEENLVIMNLQQIIDNLQAQIDKLKK